MVLNERFGFSFYFGVLILLAFSLQIVTIFFNQYFWDDQTVINAPFRSLSEQFDYTGRPYLKYFYMFFKGESQILILRGLSWLFYNIGIYFLYNIIKFYFINTRVSKFVVLFVLIFPYFLAKLNVINIYYVLGFTLFLASYYYYIYEKSHLILILILQFVSYFLLNSLVFLIPTIVILHLFNKPIKRFKPLFSEVLIFSVNLLFILIRFLYFKSDGIYNHYNEVSIDSISHSYLFFFKSIIYTMYSFFNLIVDSLTSSNYFVFLFFLFCIYFYFFVKKYILSEFKKLNFSIKWIFIQAIILFYFSSLAYNIAGQLIGFTFTVSRNQNILVVSYILFFLGVLFLLKKTTDIFFVSFISILMSTFVVASAFNIKEVFKSNMIQDSLEYNFVNDPVFVKYNNFIIDDNIESIIWKNSKRFYVYSNLYYKVSNRKENKCFLNAIEYNHLIENSNRYTLEMYKMRFINPKSKFLRIKLRSNFELNDDGYVFQNMFYYFFDRVLYNRNVSSIVSVIV